MRGSHLARKVVPTWIAAITLGLAVFAYAPTLGNATILGNVWTTGYAGGGFTAVSTALRPAEVRVESDWNSGNYSGWAGNYVYNTTYVSVDGHASPCVNSFSVSTQHSAYEPSTGDYDFASTGGSGTCESGGSSWDPEGGYCSRNAYLAALGYATKDPSCP